MLFQSLIFLRIDPPSPQKHIIQLYRNIAECVSFIWTNNCQIVYTPYILTPAFESLKTEMLIHIRNIWSSQMNLKVICPLIKKIIIS